MAAINNHLGVCCALVGANCQLDVVGEVKFDRVQRQLSAVQGAVLRGNYEVARLLIHAGASIASETYLFNPAASIPQNLLEEDGLG